MAWKFPTNKGVIDLGYIEKNEVSSLIGGIENQVMFNTYSQITCGN